jgi:hypothetical protein
VGDGGLAQAGRLVSANGVERSGAGDGPWTGRFVESRAMVEGVSDRGSRRPSRGGGESGLGHLTRGGNRRAAGGDGGVRVAAVPPPCSAKRRPWRRSQLDEVGGVT